MEYITDIYSLEAENNIIGSILMDGTNIYQAIREGLKAEHFFNESYKELYKIMLKLKNEQKPIDIVTVSEAVKSNGMRVSVSELSEMVKDTYALGNIKHHADIVIDLYNKRSIEGSLNDILSDLKGRDIQSIKNDLETSVMYCKCKQNTKELIVTTNMITDSKIYTKIYTGFKEIDKKIGGLNGGSLTIISGDSGVGKSTFINQILANVIYKGFKCVLYSGELTNNNVSDWICRTIANDSDIKLLKDEEGYTYGAVDYKAKNTIKHWLSDKLYLFNDKTRQSIENILSLIELGYEKYGAKFFVVDNLMTIEASGSDMYDRQRKVVYSLKEIAKKFDIVIIMVAHNKKNKEAKGSMYDISGASEIVNLADHIISLKRNIEIEDDGSSKVIISITKNRTSGRLLKGFPLNFDEKRKRFYEYFPNELDLDYGYNKDVCKDKQINMKQG